MADEEREAGKRQEVALLGLLHRFVVELSINTQMDTKHTE